jgi:hypothetical protein
MKTKKSKPRARAKKLGRGKTLAAVKPLQALNPQPLPPLQLPPGLRPI